MFYRYNPTVQAVIYFLRLLRVKVNDSTVDETLQNHPDWPSLLSISDSLRKWNVPNAAGKIDPEEIDRIPVPFIIYRGQMETVTRVDEMEVSLFSNGKNTIESRTDFLKKWNRVYLIAEKTDISGEKDYVMIRRNLLVNRIIPFSLILLFLGFSILFLFRNMSESPLVPVLGLWLQYIILLAGIGVSTLLLWHEIDSNNPILKKVCTSIVRGNCDAILSGRPSKVFSWLSWSEVGFFYFAGGFLSLLFVTPASQAISIIGYFNLLASPYVVFSIYYQGHVARQWCILCLCVQALLLLGAVNVLASVMLLPLSGLTIATLSECALFYLLPVAAWYTLKPDLLQLQEAKNTKREYLRIKFNTEVFSTLLQKKRTITIPTDGLGIDLGNPEATNTLVKVCNPFCGPCARAHFKIEKLLDGMSDLNIKIIFTTPNNSDDRAYNPACHLLAIAKQGNETTLKAALDEWYAHKDYETFSSLYPIKNSVESQNLSIETMHRWCDQMGITYTPTIFINGYEVPNVYEIEDLSYFLIK